MELELGDSWEPGLGRSRGPELRCPPRSLRGLSQQDWGSAQGRELAIECPFLTLSPQRGTWARHRGGPLPTFVD